MNKLTVVIITYNEETNIGRCLDSVCGIADEIIAVDSFSTDRTREIAEQKGAKVHARKFDSYGIQKNYGNALASHDYIFSIDADEVLSEELKQSIIEAKSNFLHDAYVMNRLNFLGSKPIRTCGWYPDKKLRLFRKNKGKWNEALIHEKLEMQNMVSVAHLFGDLLHYTYPTQESLIKQSDRFASIAAQQLKDKSLLYLIMKMLFSPMFKLFRNYFLNLGFMEGSLGWTICYYQSREVFLKYFLAIKMKR
ncbi:MAG: glycosyltransferase family 2 protein [Bacteroidetes bacterium]|nr:glycosyltransferase family 2 protein [Bacteroidota bacterium]